MHAHGTFPRQLNLFLNEKIKPVLCLYSRLQHRHPGRYSPRLAFNNGTSERGIFIVNAVFNKTRNRPPYYSGMRRSDGKMGRETPLPLVAGAPEEIPVGKCCCSLLDLYCTINHSTEPSNQLCRVTMAKCEIPGVAGDVRCAWLGLIFVRAHFRGVALGESQVEGWTEDSLQFCGSL